MNRTAKNRLLKLADLLEEDAKNKKGVSFDLETILSPTPGKDYKPGVHCGTTACAMGLAAISNVFKRAGLSFKFDRLGEGDAIYNTLSLTWKGDRADYSWAAQQLFDLASEEADFLFTPETYQDPDGDESVVMGAKGERRVASRIRKFVAGEITVEDVTS